jgi:hypothetical protein
MMGPATSRDKAKRAIEVMKDRADKRKAHDKMVQILEDNGKHLSSLSTLMTYPGSGQSGQHSLQSNPNIDTGSIQVTINMLMASGQHELANQMLRSLSTYQMNQLNSMMGINNAVAKHDVGKHESLRKATKYDYMVSKSTVYEINDSDRDSRFQEDSHFKPDDASTNSLMELIEKTKNDSGYDSDSLDDVYKA